MKRTHSSKKEKYKSKSLNANLKDGTDLHERISYGSRCFTLWCHIATDHIMTKIEIMILAGPKIHLQAHNVYNNFRGFYFRGSQPSRKNREILHHAKISRYTVYGKDACPCPQSESLGGIGVRSVSLVMVGWQEGWVEPFQWCDWCMYTCTCTCIHNSVDNVCGSAHCCGCVVNGDVAMTACWVLLLLLNMGGTTTTPRGLSL